MTFLLLALACSTNAPAPAAPAAAPAAPAAAPAAPAAAPAAPAAAPAPAAAWTPPNIGKCENEALLAQYSFDELANGGYCKLCAGTDQHACEMDWPTNDVPSCELWDQMRNGIYAYYGRPFETDKWKAYFAKKSWYVADPGFTDARLSPVAQKNIALLKERGEKKTGCM